MDGSAFSWLACIQRADCGGTAVAALKHVTHLAGALVCIYLALPLLPSTVLIQPKSIVVVGDEIHLVRTVTIPTTGHWMHEFERLSPPSPVSVLDCHARGVAHYEYRGSEPVVFKHDCVFEGPAESKWLFRSCWRAEGPLGFMMQPTCLTTTFFPNLPAAIRGVEEIQNSIMAVQP